MLRIDQIRLLPGDSEALLPGKCARILRLPAEDIVARLERARERVRLLAIVDTLEYLHKGGRLPTTVAIVGGLLKVKPTSTMRTRATAAVPAAPTV